MTLFKHEKTSEVQIIYPYVKCPIDKFEEKKRCKLGVSRKGSFSPVSSQLKILKFYFP